MGAVESHLKNGPPGARTEGKAAPPRVNLLFRLFPSLADLAFLVPIWLIFGVLSGAAGILEGDTGWHVRTGQWIREHGRVPDKDLFSFTKSGEPWFAWEWLWDLIFGWLHLHYGMEAVILGSVLVLCCVSVLVFRLVARSGANRPVAVAVTILGMTASTVHWWARPHLFTLLFLVIFYSILERTQETGRRSLWILPVLVVPWVNLHGGFVIGIALVCAYAAGDVLRAVLDASVTERAAALSRARRYGLTAALCGGASLANPYTYQLHQHIYAYLTDDSIWANVSEFQSLSFHDGFGRSFEALLLLSVAAAFWSVVQKRYTHALLSMAFVHMALSAARNIPLLAVIAAPVIGLAVTEWLVLLRNGPPDRYLAQAARWVHQLATEVGVLDRVRRLHLVSVAGFVLIGLLLYAPDPGPGFRASYDPKRYPVQAVEFLLSRGFTHRVLADDEWGDYLVYSAYPRMQVFMDGRSDFYGAEFMKSYLEIMRPGHEWDRKVADYGIETVLLRVEARLAAVLKASPSWSVVYDDGVAIVFRPSALRGTRSAPR